MTKDKIYKNDDFKVLSRLLTCIVSTKFAKQTANCLLNKYGTLSNIISRPLDELLSITLGIEGDIEILLQLIYEIAQRTHSPLSPKEEPTKINSL